MKHTEDLAKPNASVDDAHKDSVVSGSKESLARIRIYGENQSLLLRLQGEIEAWFLGGMRSRHVYERLQSEFGLSCLYTTFVKMLRPLELQQGQIRKRKRSSPRWPSPRAPTATEPQQMASTRLARLTPEGAEGGKCGFEPTTDLIPLEEL
jgi:hypothetical protein